MWCKMVLLVFYLSACATALDLGQASSDGAFVDLSRYRRLRRAALSYGDSESSALAFKLDERAGGGGGTANYSLTFVVANIDCAEQDMASSSFYYSYNLEMSLTILQLTMSNEEGESVSVTVASPEGAGSDTYNVTLERPFPDEAYLEKEQHLFRTWPFDDKDSSVLPAEDACAKWLRLDLVNWRRAQSSIYFSVTLHKRMRRPFTFSRWGNGCPNGDDGDFGCGYRSGNHQLCIPAKVLTCNALPNCGQETLPNADEEYCAKIFEDALRFLIFGLCFLAGVMICVGCCRSCYAKARNRSDNSSAATQATALASANRRNLQQFDRPGAGPLPYDSSSPLPRRPSNAPPTYEDATKNDNRAFVPDVEEEEEAIDLERPPPSYREIPRGDSETASSEEVTAVVEPTPAALLPSDEGAVGGVRDRAAGRLEADAPAVQEKDSSKDADGAAFGAGDQCEGDHQDNVHEGEDVEPSDQEQRKNRYKTM